MIETMFTKSLLLFTLCLALSVQACEQPQTSDQTASMQESETPRVQLVHNESEKKVEVSIDGKHVTSYFYPGEPLKKPVIYPIKTLAGNVVTRGFPYDPIPGERVDHPHHVGFWLNYGDVNGFDYWNNSDAIPEDRAERMGTIVHRSVDHMASGEEGILEVSMDWLKPDGSTILEEKTRFVFREDPQGWHVDRLTTLTAPNEEVLFKDNKEGMLGIRVTRAMEHPTDEPIRLTDSHGNAQDVEVLDNTGVTGEYTNNEGVKGVPVWGKRSNWVKLSGVINDEPVTLAILDHPDNVGHPTYWHARGYGLFAANPLGQKIFSDGVEELNFSLDQGASVMFKHRVLVLGGAEVSEEDMRSQYAGFTGQ